MNEQLSTTDIPGSKNCTTEAEQISNMVKGGL
jgi:hypothetical protein